MSMMRIVAILFLSTTSLAAAPVVKLTSGPCENPQARTASAIAFERDGASYYITAQSRVFHSPGSGDGYCHTADGEPVILVRADWGRGLALLKAGNVQGRYPSLSDALLNGAVIAGTPSVAIGFPGRLNARVLVALSNRSHSPLARFPFEAQGQPLSPSFVGGAFEDAEGRFLGMISEEFIRMIPGGSSRSTEWSHEPSARSRHYIVFNGQELLDWTLATLSGETSDEFRIDPADQAAARARVTAGKIRFTLDCPSPGEKPRPEDGYPIGGVDAAGIGGDSPLDRSCRVQLDLAPQPTRVTYGSLERQEGRWVEELTRGNRIEVPFLLDLFDSSVIDRTSVRYLFRSLPELLQELVQGRFPVDLIWEKGSTIPGVDPKRRELRRLAMENAKKAIRLFSYATLDSDSRALLRQIYSYLTILQSSQGWKLGRPQFEELLHTGDAYSRAWAAIRSQLGGDELYRSLQVMKDRIP